MVDVLLKAPGANPSIPGTIQSLQQEFATSRTTAEDLLAKANDHATNSAGLRTDKPITESQLLSNPEHMVDLSWTGDRLTFASHANVDELHDGGIGRTAWRNKTSDEYYKEFLTHLVDKNVAHIDLASIDNVQGLEAALGQPGVDDKHINQARQISDALVAYNQSLIGIEQSYVAHFENDLLGRVGTSPNDQNSKDLRAANLANYETLKQALDSAGLGADFLRQKVEVPGLGTERAVFIGYVEFRGALLAEIEYNAGRYDLAATPDLGRVHTLTHVDKVMSPTWRAESYQVLKNKIAHAVDNVPLPDGQNVAAGPWVDGLAKTIIQYNTAVLAYEAVLTRGILKGFAPAHILELAAPFKPFIDVYRDAALDRVDAAFGTGFGPREEILKTLYGELKTGEQIETTKIGATSVKDAILNTAYKPYKTGDDNGTKIHYFDPETKGLKEINTDLTKYTAATENDTGLPNQVKNLGIVPTDAAYQSGALSDDTNRILKAYKAVGDLAALPAPDIDAVSRAALDVDTTNSLAGKTLTLASTGLAIFSAGQTIVNLANGADPLTVASSLGYTLQELSDSIADVVQDVYSTSAVPAAGKFAALKAFALVAGGVGTVTSVARYYEQRQQLLDEGEPVGALDAQITLEIAGTTLMAIDSVLSTMVLTGKITGLFAKAAPIVGAVGQILLAIQPARNVFNDISADDIADIAARGDFSSNLTAIMTLFDAGLADQASDNQFYLGLANAGLSLVGAIVALGSATGGLAAAGLAIVGTLASVVVGWIDDAKAKKLAKDIQDLILEDPRVSEFQDHFDLSFQQQQQELLDKWLGVADELTENAGFGTFVGLSTQRYTQDDLYVARNADIANSLTKSAQTYVAEYRDGGWAEGGQVETTLVAADGLDLIKVAQDEDPVYLTLLNYLEASVSATPLTLYSSILQPGSKFDKDFSVTFNIKEYKDVNGWRAQDAQGNRTTFDARNIINWVDYQSFDLQRALSAAYFENDGPVFGPNEIGTYQASGIEE